MESSMKTAVDFQADGIASSSSWATWNSNISLLTNGMNSLPALTLCVRIFIPFYRSDHAVFSINTDAFVEYLSLVLSPESIYLHYGSNFTWIPALVVPGYWNSVCSQIDFMEATWSIYVNDKEFTNPINVTFDMTYPTNPVSIILGQRSNGIDAFEPYFSYWGKLTDFNMWDRLLTKEELTLYSICDLEVQGSLVKWEPEKLILNGTTSLTKVPIDTVCRPDGIYRVILSPPLLYPVAERICQTLGGNLTIEGSIESTAFELPQLLALRADEVGMTFQPFQKNKNSAKATHERDKWKRIQNLMKRSGDRESSKIHPEGGRVTTPTFKSTSNNKRPSSHFNRIKHNVNGGDSPHNKRSYGQSSLNNNPKGKSNTNKSTERYIPHLLNRNEVEEDAIFIIEKNNQSFSKNNLKGETNRVAYTNKDESTSQHLGYTENEADATFNKWNGNSAVNEELGFAAYCDFYEPPLFKVNGFCLDVMDVLEEKYVVLGRRNLDELPLFQGITGRKITYSAGDWVATGDFSPYMEMILHQTSSREPIVPIGRNEWLIMITVNEDLLDEEVKLPCDSEILFLNISPCQPGYFTCADASCLPHSVRCDRKADCSDGSDEDYCYKVDVPMTNRKDIPAQPMHGSNVTVVELKVLINRAKIEFDFMKIHADIWITWRDPSLKYYNLHEDPLANLVDVDSLNLLWTPTIEFGSNGETRIIVNNNSEVFVLKESFGKFEDYQFSFEAMCYKGKENSLQLKRSIFVDSKCTFNNFLFPFGVQTCTFPFAIISALPNAVRLTSNGPHGGVSWSGSNDDLKYEISSINLRDKPGRMYSSQELVINIHPRLGLAFLTLYLPTLFIVIIGICSFYPSPSQLEVRIGSALTCLIALFVLQIQVGTPLMGKIGVNAADIWLFGAIFIIFCINISHFRIAKDLHLVEEMRPSTTQVVPVTMMNGKMNNSRVNTSSTNLMNAWRFSNKWRKLFTKLTISLIIIYIIVFLILSAIYKS